MWIGIVFDVLLLVSISLWLIGLGADGALSVELVGYAIFGLVALMAVGRAGGMGLVRLVFRVGVPIAALAAFVSWYGVGDNQLKELLTPLLALFFVLFGIYIIFFGFFRSGRKRRRD